MKTIRSRLSLLFALFMVCLVLCGILLNALFLEDYYIHKNKSIFLATSQKIGIKFLHNKRNVADLINVIDRVNGISCIITDRELNAQYNSFPQKPGRDVQRLPHEIEQLVLKNALKLQDGYVYSVVENRKVQAPKLVFVSRMAHGELIILKKSMKGISESVAIANQFYIFAGLIIILLGGIFIFVFSERITKPVIEMSKVTEGIANLDFTKRVKADSQDELGSLGRSINKISEKLNASMNELKQDVERRKQLVRNLTHELKTPVGVIKGYAEGLKYGVVEEREKTQKYCRVISEECDRMDYMVQELLNLSMLESGMFQLKMDQFDLEEFINDIVDHFEPVLLEKEIAFELSCQTKVVLTADYELFGRVVTNYLTNAINHVEGEKLIRLTTERQSNGVRIAVFNTGKQIPANELENIWDVFYKVDKARSRQYGGHGLGLSIVKLIAELHGGIAGVENVVGGVVFFVVLP